LAVQKHSRNVMFYDIFVARRAQQAPYPSLADLAALWQQAQQDSTFPAKEFEKGAVTVIIKDADHDAANETLTLLIEVSDKNAPNATYLDHGQRTGRHIPKTAPEGNGFAAHVVMSLKAETGKANTYLALIEVIPTVNARRIASVLNYVVNKMCKDTATLFTYVKGGGKKPIAYIPHINLGGHPSDSFYTDVEEGKIHGLQLITSQSNAPLGQSPYLTIKDYSMRVNVSKDIPQGQRWSTVFSGLQLKQADFPSARIYMQPEENGPSVSVDIDSSTGTIIGDAYIKVRRIGSINPVLETGSPDTIVPHFEQHIKDILLKERT